MAHEETLFSGDGHECLRFADLVRGMGIQSNQFLITHGAHAAVLDPGGDLTYKALAAELERRINRKKLDYVLASHQDPDIIASLPHWLAETNARVVTSRLWARFLPHLSSSFVSDRVGRQWAERVVPLPDQGMELPFGNSTLLALPAHFLHSVGNFTFYDPVSRIVFSGDIGASVGGEEGPVTDFDKHIPAMEGFHRRYMAGNRACRLWAGMVRDLDACMIVPQHGGYFAGAGMVGAFLDWFERLECGMDLLDEADYRSPTGRRTRFA